MSSPFTFRLGTNYGPSDDEIPEIRSLLVEPALRLKQLDDKINELQKAIDKLSEERSGVATYIDAHQALLSPVRRMPLDIIKEIFIACLPTDRNCAMSASEAPVLLGRICSAWRAISLSTPPLWARLHVEDPYISIPHRLLRGPTAQELAREVLIKRAEVVKEWLGRSSPYPLSISLVFDNKDTEDSHILFAALREYSTRWRWIHFDIPLTVFGNMGQLSASDVPILRSIVLNHTPYNGWGPTEVAWNTLDIFRAPNLVAVGVFGISQPVVLLPLPWNKLTDLSLREEPWNTNLNSDTFLHILSKCPRLSRFEVMINQLSANDFEPGFGSLSVESTSLLILSLHLSNQPPLTFLNQLELPNLRELRLLGSAHWQPQDSPSFTRFFSVSSQLESVYLHTQLFSTGTSLELFCALPRTIERLGIEDNPDSGGWAGVGGEPRFDDRVLELLTPGAYDRPVLCPELRRITVKSCLNVSDAAILQFIRARMNAPSRPSLKLVHFQFIREKVLDLQVELQPFIQAGVDISLAYHTPEANLSRHKFFSDDIWDPN